MVYCGEKALAGGGVIADLIQNPDKSYGDIWAENLPSGVTGAYDLPHALVTGTREWLTRQPTGLHKSPGVHISSRSTSYVRDLAGNPFVATSWWFQTSGS
jgi:hypothetical protein